MLRTLVTVGFALSFALLLFLGVGRNYLLNSLFTGRVVPRFIFKFLLPFVLGLAGAGFAQHQAHARLPSAEAACP